MPLHWACDRGNTEIAKLLIEYGADVNAIGIGTSPLHWACHRGNTEMAKLLIEHGADVNASEYGRTQLHRAIDMCEREIVKLLIEYGADVNAKDESGWTPLDIAKANPWKWEQTEIDGFVITSCSLMEKGDYGDLDGEVKVAG